MYCSSCGKKLEENDAFCAQCGKRVHANGDRVPIPVDSSAAQHPVSARQTFSSNVRAVGIILIVTSSLWGVITLLQVNSLISTGVSTRPLLYLILSVIVTLDGIIRGVKLQSHTRKAFKNPIIETLPAIIWYLILGFQWRRFVFIFMAVEIIALLLLLIELKPSKQR